MYLVNSVIPESLSKMHLVYYYMLKYATSFLAFSTGLPTGMTRAARDPV